MPPLQVHLRDKPVSADVDYKVLASLTGGMSGAQISGVCNTACFLASREGRTEVGGAAAAHCGHFDVVSRVLYLKCACSWPASSAVLRYAAAVTVQSAMPPRWLHTACRRVSQRCVCCHLLA